MSISDTLKPIKEFFLNWHNTHYSDLHTKETGTLEDKDYLVYSSAVKIKTDDLQNDIDNLRTTKVDKTGFASRQGALSYHTQISDIPTVGVSDTVIGGLLGAHDKAKIDAIGRWFKLKPDPYYASASKHMTFYVNPILKLCHFSYSCDDCTHLKNSNTYTYSAPTDTGTYPIWREFPPLIYTSTKCWTSVDSTAAPIYMWMRNNGEFGLSSSRTYNKTDVYGSMLWFYGMEKDVILRNKYGRDITNVYDRTTELND